MLTVEEKVPRWGVVQRLAKAKMVLADQLEV